jgi:uncharacterized membrane protein HdeD (DUF308 family)
MKLSRLASAVMMLVLGVLFIWKQSAVINIATWVLGIALIALGVVDLLSKNLFSAIVKATLGVVILVLGNTLIDIALTIIAIIMIVLGAVQFFEIFRRRASGTERLFALISAALYIVIGVLLFLGHRMDWMFIVIGIFMIVDALCDIAYGARAGKGKRKRR